MGTASMTVMPSAALPANGTRMPDEVGTVTARRHGAISVMAVNRSILVFGCHDAVKFAEIGALEVNGAMVADWKSCVLFASLM